MEPTAAAPSSTGTSALGSVPFNRRTRQEDELTRVDSRDAVEEKIEKTSLQNADAAGSDGSVSREAGLAAGKGVDYEKGGEVEQVDPAAGEDIYPTGIRLFFIAAGLYAVVILNGLDQTIVSTAIPTITNQFDSLSDVGWYGSAYFMTSTTLQPFFGRLYAMFSLKWTFLISVVIFELGSLICAVAQNSSTFIVGRALAGVGTAGGYIGVLVILSSCIEPAKRPFMVGLNGAFYGAGAIAGPLIGGAFTSKVTWRWCFYLNLPIGGVVILAMFFLFKPPAVQSKLNLKEKFFAIDWIGTVLILGAIISILLVLQWGGFEHAWNSSVIIGLIVGFGLLLVAFAAVQIYLGDKGTIPPRLLKNRTIWSASIVNFCIGATYFTLAYFVPIYFQSVRGATAIISGVDTLPLIVSTIISVVFAGAITNVVGYTNPFMIVGGVLSSIGAGLLFTLKPDTSVGKWIGYQILAGVGVGISFMQPFVTSQVVLTNPEDAAVGGSITIFFQTLGGCLFVSIGQAIYQNKFLEGLQTIPGLNVQQVIANGVTGFREFVPASLLPQVIQVSSDAVDDAFACAIALGCLWTVSTAFLTWKTVKGANIQAAAG